MRRPALNIFKKAGVFRKHAKGRETHEDPLHTPRFRSLRVTLLAGFMLLLLSGTALTFFLLIERSGYGTSRQQDNFARLRSAYDTAAEGIAGTSREIDQLQRELDRLERGAVTVESWLSVLKRRRALANIHPPSLVNYRNSANNALQAFPHSQPIAAIAAAALVKDSSLNMEAQEHLRQMLSIITDSSFNTLRLALYTILGDFRSPERAAELPANLFSDGTEAVAVNLTILKIMRGDFRGALMDILAMLDFPSPSVDTLYFAADYHYDFGDLLRSAEIFSLINSEDAMIRQADALYLAGYTELALVIWKVLADHQNETGLYNLALTAEDPDEVKALLERLANMDGVSNARQYGLIRYSRLLDYSQAISLLGRSDMLNFAGIDLEISKRYAQSMDIGRQLADAWLLLDRHEQNANLYNWAAWLFLFQRRFEESEILLNRAEMHQFNSQWVDIYRAIQFMNEGNLYEAEDLLTSITAEQAPWYAFANLGRIYETIYSSRRALTQYELAAANVQNPKAAAQIQIRIARCFAALNQHHEARRALLYALEYDPQNLIARLELDRMF